MTSSDISIKVSIVVPVYNVEKYLIKTIESILNQRYENIELILVNDGSTDRSGEVCDIYKSNKVKVIHKKNSGLSEARNVGIAQSTGDYIMFIDSDDWIIDGCIEEIVEIINMNEGIDLVVGRMINYYQDEDKYDDDKYIFNDISIKNGVESIKYLYGELYGQLWGAGRGIYKKRLFVENEIYFKSGIISEDLECIPKLYLKAKTVAFYNRPYYIYRRSRVGSITSDIKKKNFLDTFQVIKDWDIELQYKTYDDVCNKSFYMQLGEVISGYYDNIGCLNSEDRYEVEGELIKIYKIMKYTRKKNTYFKYLSTKLLGVKLTTDMLKYKNIIRKNLLYLKVRYYINPIK